MPHKFWPDWVRMGLLALCYGAVAKFNVTYLVVGDAGSRFWMPSGISLAALLIYGARLWPGIAIGAFCAAWTPSVPLGLILSIAVGSTLEPVVSCWLLRSRKLGFQASISHLRDYFLLLLIGAVAVPIITADTGALAIALAGLTSWDRLGATASRWWMGNALGVVALTPLLLLWHRASWQRSEFTLEAGLMLLAVNLWGQIVFGGWFAATLGPYARGFTLFPLIGWAALRTGPRWTALATAAVTGEALWGAIRGVGYFATDIADTRLFNFWLYSSVLNLTGTLLATVVAERRQAEQEAYTARERLQLVINTIPHCVFWKDLESRYLGGNERFARFVGRANAEELIGKTDYDLATPEHADIYRQDDRQVLASGQGKYNYQETASTSEGARIWLETSKVPLYGRTHGIEGVLGIFQDITRRKRREDMLRQAVRVFESIQEGIVITDVDGVIESVNPAFTQITGYDAAEVLGKNPRILKSDVHDLAFFQNIFSTIRGHGYWQGEVVNRRKSGETYTCWQTISAITDDEGRLVNYVAVFSDISPIKLSQEKLQHLAHHDPLTGLPNRLLLRDRLEQATQRAARNGTQLAVMFLDLDRFKDVNDSLGHTVGDALLQAVAERLRGAVRRVDTLARLGGDEFTILMEGLHHGEDASHLAEKLMRAVSEPLVADGHEFFLGASIGISIYPQDAQSAEALLQNADAAMYRAKETGRGIYVFYSEDMTDKASRRVTLERELRRAIERGELVLHYQPQVDLLQGRITGVEALVRWIHPDRGLLLPKEFIPFAEESGLMVSLGEWVLRSACAQAKAWLDAGIDFGCVAVNIAGPQILRGNLMETVRRILGETGLPPERLDLEISETTIMTQASQTLDPLLAVRDLGVTLAVDDFGTGYSSLAYLKQLPVNKLKLDKTFVDDLPQGDSDAAIARSVIALGRSLGYAVVAEGVETAAQRDFLRAEGCHQAQGFLYSPALTADALSRILQQGIKGSDEPW